MLKAASGWSREAAPTVQEHTSAESREQRDDLLHTAVGQLRMFGSIGFGRFLWSGGCIMFEDEVRERMVECTIHLLVHCLLQPNCMRMSG